MRFADPVIPETVAVIWNGPPVAIAVANPVVATIVVREVFAEAQLAWVVKT